MINEHRRNTASLLCALWRNFSHRGAPFDSAFYPSVATSYRIVEHHYTGIHAPFSSATCQSVTSSPGSTSRAPPALFLQGGWSLRLRRNACRPVILTQRVQLWNHSWYTCEHLRTATCTRARPCYTCGHLRSETFTHACCHVPVCSTQGSVDATQPLCKAVWRNLTTSLRTTRITHFPMGPPFHQHHSRDPRTGSLRKLLLQFSTKIIPLTGQGSLCMELPTSDSLPWFHDGAVLQFAGAEKQSTAQKTTVAVAPTPTRPTKFLVKVTEPKLSRGPGPVSLRAG